MSEWTTEQINYVYAAAAESLITAANVSTLMANFSELSDKIDQLEFDNTNRQIQSLVILFYTIYSIFIITDAISRRWSDSGFNDEDYTYDNSGTIKGGKLRLSILAYPTSSPPGGS